ncbi:MAG: methyltransferase domain-containing protein [Bacteroidetes bacterium]|nr:methyltransferase domain-containing protein [Bacteroidota bacterium]
MTTTPAQWYKNWFDSPYYHILYKHRDYYEAESFIDNLLHFLKPAAGSRFLDLGCGKGRHSIYLNKKGYPVIGIDLSTESIAHASQFQNDSLQFYVHDMRKSFRINYFNYVLNLFTSFGYFENQQDNIDAIDAVNRALKSKGIFVLDFLNIHKVVSKMIEEETQIVDDITFHISRSIENKFIVKNIHFSDQGAAYHFQERVKMLSLTDFEKYFADKKLKILHLLGNYKLEKFDENTSDRLIIIAEKQ